MRLKVRFPHFPIILTQRLILRQIIAADDRAIFAIRGDYEVTKYNIGDAYTHIKQAQDLITSMQEEFENHGSIRWGITRKADDTVIGMVGFNYWDKQNNRASIGFDLARAHWRKGIMREALCAMLNFGFINMGLHRIAADASLENEASWKLMSSLGFTQEGILRDQYYEHGDYHDLVILSILAHEWNHIK